MRLVKDRTLCVNSMPIEIISKFDAATRQLDTAITLWFLDGDPVSSHTLACSAYQIIHDINQQKGWRDLLYDSLITKDEFRDDAKRLLKCHYNYFKHSDKDPDGTIEFNPSITEIYILFSLFGLELFGIKHNEIRGAFIIWHAIHNPNRLTEKGKKQYIENISPDNISKIRNSSRNDFFHSYTLFKRQFKSEDR
jgi:hypothetical protein